MRLARSHVIDRYLWPAVSSWLGYTVLILLCTFLCPLLLGLILPPTVIGIVAYFVFVVALCTLAAMVQNSRDRWVAFRSAIRRDRIARHAPRHDPTWRKAKQAWARAEDAWRRAESPHEDH